MPSKLSREEIEQSIRSFPYILISGDIHNTRSPLIFQCDIHGEFRTTLKAIRKGYQCRKCAAIKRAARNITDLDSLLSTLKDRYSDDVKYVSDYQNKGTKAMFVCSKHGEFSTTFENILRKNAKHACLKCSYEIRSRQKTNLDHLKHLISKTEYEYLDIRYENSKAEIHIFCPHHNIRNWLEASKIKTGRFCKLCSYEKTGLCKRIPKEKAADNSLEKGYRMIGEYSHSVQKMDFECKIHGPFTSTYNSIMGGHGCPSCGSRQGKTQQELFDFIASLAPNSLKNDRTTLKSPDTNRPLELDILVPDKKLAIEYCGLYWHNEDSPHPRGKNAHKLKHDLCKAQNIQLITIFEDEWLERESQIRTILKAKLGLLPKIYGRKTKVVVLDRVTVNNFLNKNHLQGTCIHILALGLTLEGEIVACATLSKHHRQNRNEAVLSRVCFGDKAVLGGTSKLLNALLVEARNMGFSDLVSWSDNRWSDGGVYQELGMEPFELPPDYSYVIPGSYKRASKQSCQKKHLLKKGAVGNTEHEMAKSLGYSRIWDCGKVRWSLKI